MILINESVNENYHLLGEVYLQSEDNTIRGMDVDKGLIIIRFIPNKDWNNEKSEITNTIVRVSVTDLHGKDLSDILVKGGFDVKGYDKSVSYLSYKSEKLHPDCYVGMAKDICGIISSKAI